MMKVALIGDIHANLPALEAVLEHARQNAVESLWNLGDFVGYGAFPEETVNRMRATNAINILGNYDRKVLKVPHKAKNWKKHMQPDKWLAFTWTYDHLSPSSRAYLEALPTTVSGKLDRKALPDIGSFGHERRRPMVAPRSDAERVIAQAFARALRLSAGQPLSLRGC